MVGQTFLSALTLCLSSRPSLDRHSMKEQHPRMPIARLLCAILLIFCSCNHKTAAPPPPPPQTLPPRLLSVTKIHDAAPHNAFTDLTHFNNHWYCAFREGSGHVPGSDGVIRVLRSPDANTWTSIAEL